MRKNKIDYIKDILYSGGTISQLEAYKLVDDDGFPIPHTRLSDAIFKMRASGIEVESLTPEEANKRLGYHKYDKGQYTVYALKDEKNGGR